jgi:hypothetical protein
MNTDEKPNTKQDKRVIYCTACEKDVDPRLTDGSEIYPHRPDLASLPFWICDTCGNYVGCHHNTDNPTNPKGVIPTKEMRDIRVAIHRLLDPLWQSKRIKRGKAYAYISHRLGYTYHTGELKSVEEGREIYKIVLKLKEEL